MMRIVNNPYSVLFWHFCVVFVIAISITASFHPKCIFFPRRQSQLTVISIPHKAILILQRRYFCDFLCILPCSHICDYNLQNWQLRSSPWFMGSSICTQLTAGEYRPAYFCPAVDTKCIVLKVDNIANLCLFSIF